jgi:hypothetical protein
MRLALFALIFTLSALAQVPGGRITEKRQEGPAKPTPRLPDGKPDLGGFKGAWNPRTIANIAGVGRQGPGRSPIEKLPEVKFLPWAQKYYDEAQENLAKDDPEARCLPPGIPRMYATPFPFQILQLENRVVFLFEGGTHIYRVVPLDGRKHSEDPNPTYLGEPIGWWEEDTLVVDTIGFNERSWLDQDGHPHSEKLHTIERFTRTDERTLHYQVTIDDPGAYAEPWTTSWTIPWSAGEELWEYVCQENNKDVDHLFGK